MAMTSDAARDCDGCYEESSRLTNFLGADGRLRALCFGCFNREEQRMSLRFENLRPSWRRVRKG